MVLYFGCPQLALSMGISYEAVVRLELTLGRCLKDVKNREQEEEQSGLGEGSYQTHWTMSGAFEYG